MIPKSGNRFSDKIMLKQKSSAANLRFLSFVAASSFRNLKFKSRTRFIELLVVLRFRSSYRNMPRALTNFGIGPLVFGKAPALPPSRRYRDREKFGMCERLDKRARRDKVNERF